MADASSLIPVTVIILTYNEEINIARCVQALEHFSEVIVVDSGSSDATCRILAEEFPQVRLLTHHFEDFGQQRNWAIDHSDPKHEWILFVDADEFMDPPLAEEIRAFVDAPGPAVGAFIAGRSYFLGAWIRRSTYFPTYQLRLLKSGSVRYERAGHGQQEVTEGEVVYLKQTWRHEAFSKGVEDWISRHNRYSTTEIDLIVHLRSEPISFKRLGLGKPVQKRRELKKIGARIPCRALGTFVYGYFWRRGFMDGLRGLQYNLLRFAHEIHVEIKLSEAKQKAKIDPPKGRLV